MNSTQYQFHPENFHLSDPNRYTEEDLKSEEMLISLGPQHPSTHGVLRLEVISDGEWVKDVIPHLGYLHRCFEKHAQSLPFNQTNLQSYCLKENIQQSYDPSNNLKISYIHF
jgi:NADH-quinone oxidoreductase subunit D